MTSPGSMMTHTPLIVSMVILTSFGVGTAPCDCDGSLELDDGVTAACRVQPKPNSTKITKRTDKVLLISVLPTEPESVCMVKGPLRFRAANGLDWSTGSSLTFLLLYEEAAALGLG